MPERELMITLWLHHDYTDYVQRLMLPFKVLVSLEPEELMNLPQELNFELNIRVVHPICISTTSEEPSTSCKFNPWWINKMMTAF